MEYISEKEYKDALLKVKLYKKHCKDLTMPCAICGEKSTTYINSIMGAMKWYMCDLHKSATTYFGAGEMGVEFNGVDTPMKFLSEQIIIKEKLKDL